MTDSVQNTQSILPTLCKLRYFFLFRWVWNVFFVHSLSGSCYYIKNEKAGNFVRLLDRVTHRKRPKFPNLTHRMATIFTDLSRYLTAIVQKSVVIQHILLPFICTLENCSRTDFGFLHMTRIDISVLFGHVRSQTLPHYDWLLSNGEYVKRISTLLSFLQLLTIILLELDVTLQMIFL